MIFLLLATERERFDRALLVSGSEDEDSARDSVAIAVIVEEEEEDERACEPEPCGVRRSMSTFACGTWWRREVCLRRGKGGVPNATDIGERDRLQTHQRIRPHRMR